MTIKTEITIKRTLKPRGYNIDEELQWFCDSLGLFGSRDKDKSCFRMFVILLKNLSYGEGLTSDKIAEKVNLSRGTVVHHLHKLIKSGIVINRENKYMLRVDNLTELIDEIERDILKTMKTLRKVAQDLDNKLNL